jgi:hypothetical protein
MKQFFKAHEGRTGYFESKADMHDLVNLFFKIVQVTSVKAEYQKDMTAVSFKSGSLIPFLSWVPVRENVAKVCQAIDTELSRLLFSDDFMLYKVIYAHGKQRIAKLRKKLGSTKEGGAKKNKSTQAKEMRAEELATIIRKGNAMSSGVNPDAFTVAEKESARKFWSTYFSDYGGKLTLTPEGICNAIKANIAENDSRYCEFTNLVFRTILTKLGFYGLKEHVNQKKYEAETIGHLFDNQLCALASLTITQEHSDMIEELSKELDQEESIEAGFGNCMRFIQPLVQEIMNKSNDRYLRQELSRSVNMVTKSHDKQLMERRTLKTCLNVLNQEIRAHTATAQQCEATQKRVEDFEYIIDQSREAAGKAGVSLPKVDLGPLNKHREEAKRLAADNLVKGHRINTLAQESTALVQRVSDLEGRNNQLESEVENLTRNKINDGLLIKFLATQLSRNLIDYRRLRIKQAARGTKSTDETVWSNHKLSCLGLFTYGDKMAALDAFESFVSGQAHDLDEGYIPALANKRLSNIVVAHAHKELRKMKITHPWQLDRALRKQNEGRKHKIHGNKAIIHLWKGMEIESRANKQNDQRLGLEMDRL